ncbi:MAG: response regulator transcription factor [Chloroflexi bacterium]|nr:response regulator transcription factor [Chloroflexota bacterium]
MKGNVKVLLVDDHPVVREGLRNMLASEPGIEVVGEVASGEEAIEKSNALSPNVVLMDIRMPGMNGIEATQQIKKNHPSICIIMLTMYDSEMYIVEAVRSGAAGYLTKDASRDLLCHAVKAAMDGGVMLRSALLVRAIQGIMPLRQEPGDTEASSALSRLTPREMEVLRLLAQGQGNKEICASLNLAEVTVKKHVQSIMGKLGCSDRTHAAILGVRLGLAT